MKHTKFRTHLVSALLLTILMASCQEDIPIDTNPLEAIQKPQLEVVWQQPCDPNKERCDDFDMYTNKDGITYVVGRHKKGEGSKIRCINTINGEQKWEQPPSREARPSHALFDNGDFIYRGGGVVTQINAVTGIASYSTPATSWWNFPTIGVSPQNIFYSAHSSNNDDERVEYLVKMDRHTGRVDTLKTFNTENGFEPGLKSFVAWADENGDEIVFFQNWQDGPGQSLKIDLYAYNVTVDLVKWTITNVGQTPYYWDAPPFSDAERLYFITEHKLFCIDKDSGQIVWQNPVTLTNRRIKQDLAIHEDRLFLYNYGFKVYDKNTGALIHEFDEIPYGSEGEKIHIYDGVAYTRTGKTLLAFDLEKLEAVWAQESPNVSEDNRHTAFDGEIAIDPSAGLLVIADHDAYMGIKLYERK